MPHGWSKCEILYSRETLVMEILLALSHHKKEAMLMNLCYMNPILVLQSRM
jgi:hypothetical protein